MKAQTTRELRELERNAERRRLRAEEHETRRWRAMVYALECGERPFAVDHLAHHLYGQINPGGRLHARRLILELERAGLLKCTLVRAFERCTVFVATIVADCDCGRAYQLVRLQPSARNVYGLHRMCKPCKKVLP